MASIPSLLIEQVPELLQSIQTMTEVNPTGAQLTDANVKECLSSISKALQATVQSITTVKNSVITETSTADVAFKKLEVSFADLCARTDASIVDINTRLLPPGISPGGKPSSAYNIHNTTQCVIGGWRGGRGVGVRR